MPDQHTVEHGDRARMTFFAPSERLRPFVTTYYLMEIDAPGDVAVNDWLHPEWANIRFVTPGAMQAAIGGDGCVVPMPSFVVTGPTSIATHFSMRSGRSWGIGLLPAGWSQFFSASANGYANRAVDGNSDETFARLASLAQALPHSQAAPAQDAQTIDEHLLDFLGDEGSKHAKIALANSALIDPEVTSVKELAMRVGISVRSMERLSLEAFGFSPKALLARQRFLRSLAQFMLDPSLRWLETMDWQYHDQAHFSRDFRRFMTMSPSEYAKLDKPVMLAAAKARARLMGEAVQVLHAPDQSKPGG